MMILFRIPRRWRIALLSVYWAVAFGMTHTPGGDIDLVPSFLTDTAMHALGYCILGGLSIWVLAASRPRLMGTTILAAYAGLLAYGAIDEWTQPLVNRSCELSDWIADAAGAALGVLLVSRFVAWYSTRAAAQA